MSVSLYLAPAGAGKTQFALELVQEAARDLNACPRICVANRQQLVSWQQRLVQNGGCIGVHVQTFDDLFQACLQEAGQPFTLVDNIVQFQLLGDVTTSLSLRHFAAVRAMPGFIQELQRLIRELKSAYVRPDAFLDALRAMGEIPRLHEIALIYAQYEQQLASKGLTDYPGLGWMALSLLEESSPSFANDWGLLVLDGFASFTETQLRFLQLVRQHVDKIAVTLTGDWQNTASRTVHRHFDRTRQRIEDVLETRAQPLEKPGKIVQDTQPTAPRYLTRNLFRKRATDVQAAGGEIALISAPDHAAEVRVALRWLKGCMVEDGIEPHEVALAARDIEPYRPFIAQAADEYGLPLHFVDGPPLQKNPCIAAILNLLRMLRPKEDSVGADNPILPRRNLLSALRSPYFDWQCLCEQPGATGDESQRLVGPTKEDVHALDAISRRDQIIAGADQWREAFRRLARIEDGDDRSGARDDEIAHSVPQMPYGSRVARLKQLFERILERLQPPQGQQSREAFVRWLDGLLGPDTSNESAAMTHGTLNLVACVREGRAATAPRDMAALHTLKDILRGILWSEKIGFAPEAIDYSQFVGELEGAVEAARYQQPAARDDSGAIVVSDVMQARGVPCRALAIMGLAEGLFPASLAQDPLLTESDRLALRTRHGLPLDSAIESFEPDYFYETLARSRERLLLTRPTQAESGAMWEASTFWTEVQRLCDRPGGPLVHDVEPLRAGSKTEIFDLLARAHAAPSQLSAVQPAIRQWLRQEWKKVEAAASIVRARRTAPSSPFNGWLDKASTATHQRFGPSYGWSASRLESYLACPLQFFLSAVLGLEARPEPQEGLDARQLGNIYHRIFEETYASLPLSQRTIPETLRESLESAADRVLEEAPRREGFRESSWWSETKDEIRRNARKSLEKLLELPGDYVPTYFERYFGASHALWVEREHDRFQLRGIVDRVDVDDQGHLRLIDYKTAGPTSYDPAAHRDGKRLQLPFYAIAVENALQLGTVAEGFYWHIQKAEASRFSLKACGPQNAIETAIDHAWRAIDGARDGKFAPQPPDGGCPDYCPGAAFCWQYQPRRSF